MGWDYTQGATRADIIARRTRTWETDKHSGQTLFHKAVGNTLWTVNEVTEKEAGTVKRFIGCDILGNDPGFGWGYKDMEESMHPYDYSCPMEYLEMVPVACQEWRDEVKKYHAIRKQTLAIGQTIRLGGCNIKSVRISSLKPLTGYDENGKLWKIPKRFVALQTEAQS